MLKLKLTVERLMFGTFEMTCVGMVGLFTLVELLLFWYAGVLESALLPTLPLQELALTLQ